MIEVTITDSQHVGLRSDVFDSLTKQVLEAANYKDLTGELAFVLVGDKEIQELNKTYRGKDAPTDVLSFSYLDETAPQDDQTIGELIISTDTAQRQADEQNHKLSTEIEVLFVHGLLHILGFDHEEDGDKQKMLDAERKVLGEKAGLIQRNQG